MGFLWPVHKESGARKSEEQLSPSERVRIAEDIERDQTSNVQRGQKVDTKAIDQGVRLMKGVKGREGYFDELLRQVTEPAAKAAKA